MVKTLIISTLFAFGGTGVALAAYLGAGPSASTSPVREAPPIAAERSPAVAAASVPMDLEDDSSSVLLAEVQITATRPRATKRPVMPASLEPCSEWRHVGVLVVDHGIVVGVRDVRVLCVRPGDKR